MDLFVRRLFLFGLLAFVPTIVANKVSEANIAQIEPHRVESNNQTLTMNERTGFNRYFLTLLIVSCISSRMHTNHTGCAPSVSRGRNNQQCHHLPD